MKARALAVLVLVCLSLVWLMLSQFLYGNTVSTQTPLIPQGTAILILLAILTLLFSYLRLEGNPFTRPLCRRWAAPTLTTFFGALLIACSAVIDSCLDHRAGLALVSSSDGLPGRIQCSFLLGVILSGIAAAFLEGLFQAFGPVPE